MIFAGDVAIAPNDHIVFKGFPPRLLAAPWCINLEGPILAADHAQPEWSVVNSPTWRRSFERFNLGPVFLGNNHISDLRNGISLTTARLSSDLLVPFGAGRNAIEAAAPAVAISDGITYRILGFGWPVIGCRPAGLLREGVNPLEGQSACKAVEHELRAEPDGRVIVVIHGNYEMEPYPQPGHRALSQDLIDRGAYAVIWHHPHVVGPIERYRGRTIAYSLGNWAFSYGRFFNGKLRFSDQTFGQLALELTPYGDVAHRALFEPPSSVRYVAAERVNDESFSLRAEFEGLAATEYFEWFRARRIKKKALPIYRHANGSLGNWVRDRWVGARQIFVDTIQRTGLRTMLACARRRCAENSNGST